MDGRVLTGAGVCLQFGFRGLVSLSMAASVRPVYEFVDEFLADSLIDISDLLAKLNRASTQFRLPIIRRIEKVLVSYL
jgi:hypothetical protein